MLLYSYRQGPMAPPFVAKIEIQYRAVTYSTVIEQSWWPYSHLIIFQCNLHAWLASEFSSLTPAKMGAHSTLRCWLVYMHIMTVERKALERREFKWYTCMNGSITKECSLVWCIRLYLSYLLYSSTLIYNYRPGVTNACPIYFGSSQLTVCVTIVLYNII